MNLADLNARWRETGHPHAEKVLSDPAEPVGGRKARVPGDENNDRVVFRWHCPACHREGQSALPLVGAMSSALAHKNHCGVRYDSHGGT